MANYWLVTESYALEMNGVGISLLCQKTLPVL